VRRFAREIGIELARVTGSGPNGRVSVEDVKAFARKLNEGAAARPAATPPVEAPLPNFARWGEVERKPMSHIRRATAEHLVECWNRIPHVTHFDKADITELETLRRKFAPKAEAQGGKLTMAVMVVKAAAAALKVFPKFNSSIDMARREIVFKKYCHVGIAVNTERGLLVPVLRDADRKNMIQIAVEVNQIAEKARKGKLALEDMQGGCFTVTNLGRVAGTYFTPIVNHPEVAILGMGRTFEEARFVNGTCVPRTVLPLSLSYDHRLIDGADGAEFLRWIVEAIEEPLLLSLQG
jgi:pyruvate dehydrogenase E2 component (dihydrolipoamide acetyltransferase)